jgi:hypothetical protein
MSISLGSDSKDCTQNCTHPVRRTRANAGPVGRGHCGCYSRALEERGSQDFRRGVLMLGVFAALLLILIGIGLAL